MNLAETIKKAAIQQIAGVTIHFLKTDEYVISFALLKREGNNIKIIQTRSGINQIELLKEDIKSNVPIWLTVTGRPVILRKLQNDPGEKHLNIILPNARENEFTVSVTKGQSGEVFVAAIRKEVLENLKTDFHDSEFKILGFSVGPAPVSVLYETGLVDDKKLTIPGYEILAEENKIYDIIPKEKGGEKSYVIGKDSIGFEIILPFAAAFSYLFYRSGFDNLTTDYPAIDAETILYKQLSRAFLLLALAFIFGILFINFIAFNYYSKKEQELTAELSYQDAVFAQSDSLKSEISLKKNLIDEMGLSQNTTYGYYADRIAAIVPDGIRLHLMSINPLASKIKSDKPIQFEKYIRLKGEASGSMLLNEWIKELGKYDWIRNVEIIGYEKKENKGEFEINILY